MMPKTRKKLKNNDPLNFEDIVDRGDLSMRVREQWFKQHTVGIVTALAKKHPGKPWRIFRIEEGLWYAYDRQAEEWIGGEIEEEKHPEPIPPPVIEAPSGAGVIRLHKKVCAWHTKHFGFDLVLREGIEPTTHGICPDCFRKEKKEIEDDCD